MKTLVWLLAILCCSNLAWPCANFHSSATKLSGESTRATITADRTLESARKLLSLSMEYGVPQARIQPLLDRYDRRIAARRYKEFTFKVAAAAAVLGLIFGLLYRLHKSGHFVISSTSGRAHS